MIDKEKLLKFLNKREYDCGDCTVNEIILTKEEIESGNLDIEKPKETCKWTLYSKSREYKTHDYFVRTKSECGRKTDEYADFGFSEYAPYCPYCGKEIDEVKHA